MAMNFARMYSAGAGLARSDVEKRVLDILAGFNKVDAKKVNTTHCITELEIAHASLRKQHNQFGWQFFVQGRSYITRSHRIAIIRMNFLVGPHIQTNRGWHD